jgi:hypothetical protein
MIRQRVISIEAATKRRKMNKASTSSSTWESEPWVFKVLQVKKKMEARELMITPELCSLFL